MAEEELIAGEVAVGDADVTDVAAGSSGADELGASTRESADRLDDRMRAESVGEVL